MFGNSLEDDWEILNGIYMIIKDGDASTADEACEVRKGNTERKNSMVK